MPITPAQLPDFINAISATLIMHADAITALDQAIGDGDHVFNLQRGIEALQNQSAELASLDWAAAWQKIGMTIMAAIGGASGSLYATLFINLHKHTKDKPTDMQTFADALQSAVAAVKLRGKADVGEKTMLDVWVPVAETLQQTVAAGKDINAILEAVCAAAEAGVESTRDMLATKGRASFLGERSKGHIDAGAKTAQLMIAAIARQIKLAL